MWPDDTNRSPSSSTQPRYSGHDRRTAPRIETPFPVIVRSVDVADRWFEEHTVLDNLSSTGLYLRLVQQAQQGIRLFGLIRLAVTPNTDASVAFVALHGVVLRTEPRPGGVFGTAIRFTHHRFIYSAAEYTHSGILDR
jgi:hypothetical protein